MLAWYVRATLLRRWRVVALSGSMGRALTHRGAWCEPEMSLPSPSTAGCGWSRWWALSSGGGLPERLRRYTKICNERYGDKEAPSCVAPTHAIGARLQNGRPECANDLYRQRQLHQMQIHGLR